MIGYCPLDEDPIERPQRQEVVAKPQVVKRKKRSILGEDVCIRKQFTKNYKIRTRVSYSYRR